MSEWKYWEIYSEKCILYPGLARVSERIESTGWQKVKSISWHLLSQHHLLKFYVQLFVYIVFLFVKICLFKLD